MLSNPDALSPAAESTAPDTAALSPGERRALLALLFGALVVRLVFVLGPGARIHFGDEAEYIDGARRLLAGEPLPQHNWMFFVRAPGYSLFLAAIWKLVGSESVPAVRVVQALLATGACAFTFGTARALRATATGALAAAALAASYPYLIYFTAPLGTESVFAFFVAGGAYFCIRGIKRPSPSLTDLAAGGLFLGLGNLIRPNMTTVLPCIGAWLLFRYRKRLVTGLTAIAVLAIPIVLVALPWTVATERAGLGRVWVTDGGPVWYYMGHNDEAYELACGNPTPERRRVLLKLPSAQQFTQRPDYQRAASLPPKERQAEFMRAALAWDRAHLSAQPCLAMRKFYDYWRPWVSLDAYSLSIFFVSLLSIPGLLLGAWGTVLSFRKGDRVGSLYAWILAGTGTFVAAVCSTEIRYRIPIVDVTLLPFAGIAADTLLQFLRSRRKAA